MSILLFNLKNYLSVDESLRVAKSLGRAEKEHEVIVAPQHLSLYGASKMGFTGNSSLCAQNFDYAESYGAHTGDVLVQDLKMMGCKYALIGHSEVRHRNEPRIGESDELIAKKVRLCFKHGITPVVCFGETGKEKDSGETEEVARRQLSSAFHYASAVYGKEALLAYEPVWAISSSKNAESCNVDYVSRIFEVVRKTVPEGIKYRFLYGGSVNGDNIRTYMSSGFIDGVLIGRAGTEPQSLSRIMEALKG
jgi:triosephosphate isomerase